MKKYSYQKALKLMFNTELPFSLVNLDGRPVFVRPVDKDDDHYCDHCDKKAIMLIYEIDKLEHYSSWASCGNPKHTCD